MKNKLLDAWVVCWWHLNLSLMVGAPKPLENSLKIILYVVTQNLGQGHFYDTNQYISLSQILRWRVKICNISLMSVYAFRKGVKKESEALWLNPLCHEPVHDESWCLTGQSGDRITLNFGEERWQIVMSLGFKSWCNRGKDDDYNTIHKTWGRIGAVFLKLELQSLSSLAGTCCWSRELMTD